MPARSLGEIVLRPHQSSAATRIAHALAEFGGALLCDDVGMGKTFTVLAVAQSADRPLVVGPAALRAMWFSASGAAGIPISYASFEGLSRNAAPEARHDFLIVDEAHNARNPATRRYRRLSRLASGVPLVMLSATPVHNRKRDLTALLALFLGSRADALTEPEFARCVIRRERGSVNGPDGLPRITPPRWCHLSHDDSLPEALLALPPPLPPRDGGDGGVLITHSLIRQWASSDAALRAGLRRRLRKAIALISALESGVYPSDAELSAWTEQEDSMQLAFPVLVAAELSSANRARDVADELLATARAHAAAIRNISRSLAGGGVRDEERASVIRELVGRHSGIGVVAFSQYSETVMSLFRALAPAGEVAALTSRGARVAGGKISRADAIGRFAPHAAGATAPGAADRVSLLLTTDLLSEGVNLQDAGVVVHLDIPWTPARMEQRLGRIARLGSPHERVWSYALKPPASANTLLRIERRIHEKLAVAGMAVGDFQPVLPSATPTHPARCGLREGPPFSAANPAHSTLCGPPAVIEVIRNVLSTWLVNETTRAEAAPQTGISPAGDILVTAVEAADDGFLAACVVAGRRVLLTSAKGAPVSDLSSALNGVRQCSGDTVLVSTIALSDALKKLHSHLIARDALRGLTPDSSAVARSRSAVLRRISAISRRSPSHLRARAAMLVQSARSAVMKDMGIAAESNLRRLASAVMDDEPWLLTVALGANERPRADDEDPAKPAMLVALILLQKTPRT